MLQSIVLVIHLLVAALIVVFVLLQRGKGAEAGTGFGAGASGTVFGARGTASFFSRVTAILATLFFATSLGLAYFATQRSAPQSVLQGSVLDKGESTQSGAANEPAKQSEAQKPAATPAPAAQTPSAQGEKAPAAQAPAVEAPAAKSGGAPSGGEPKK